MGTLLMDNKELMKEYNYKKNHSIDLNNATLGSSLKIWWRCKNGHEWEATIVNRSRGTGCPYCSGRRAIVGENDLLTSNPKLAKEWNYEKNGELKPNMITANCGKKVWWKCEKGHEWEVSVGNRNRGTGCPFCGNKKLLKGYNDLSTVNSKLAEEWNYEKNGDLKPDMVSPNTNKRVWWKCEKGHQWQAAIYSRNSGTGCPYCSKELQTSFPEQAIYYYIKKLFPDAINGDQHIGMELDIYIPSRNIAVEYDGIFWHKNSKNDERKNKLCVENKIVLFRIKENIENIYYENEYLKIIPCTYSDSGLKLAIEKLFEYLNKNVNVDLDRDRASIYSSFIQNQKEHSLLSINPLLSKEWNYEKNGDLKPDMVLANSGKKVWWKCKKGHEWLAVIRSRNDGSGCPYCSNQKVLKGYNDLATVNSKLSKDWNYEKNGDLKPDMITKSSEKKVWWKCKKGHEWRATIVNRSHGSGCLVCKNFQVLVGYNDLATVNPKLAKEWNYEKNIELKPEMFIENSIEKVWWKCENGHEWEATIINRTRGNGCPLCSGRQIVDGENDLATINPNLAKEWNYDKNGELKPNMVAANSGKKVWWKCIKEHEWEATVAGRNKGTGCPICKNKKVLKGYNDLATINPILAKEWNYEKNDRITPNMIAANSNKKAWWKCANGHEWQASIVNRNRGTKCPFCNKMK